MQSEGIGRQVSRTEETVGEGVLERQARVQACAVIYRRYEQRNTVEGTGLMADP